MNIITLEEIINLELEKVYTFRYTNKFIGEFKQLQSILDKIGSEQSRSKSDNESAALILFIMGRMKDVVNLLRVTQSSSSKFKFIEAVALKNLGYANDAKSILEDLLNAKDIKKELVVKELVEIHLNLGNFEQAKNIYEDCLNNKDSNFAKFIQARLFEYAGDIDGAVAIYEELKEKEEFKVEALHRLFYLANIFLEPEEVKKYEEQIQKLPQSQVSIIANLALYYEMNNRSKEAIKLIEPLSGLYNQRLHYLIDEIRSSTIMFFDEDIERQKKYTQKLLEIPIDATGVSIRTRNILFQKNIRTIGDLVKYTESDIQSISALGEGGFKEIKDMLTGLNLEFAKVTHIETEEEKKYIALLNQSISNVYWTPRTRSLLDRNNIKVWGDLANLKEEEVRKWQEISTPVINEIKQKMLQQGIMFKS